MKSALFVLWLGILSALFAGSRDDVIRYLEQRFAEPETTLSTCGFREQARLIAQWRNLPPALRKKAQTLLTPPQRQAVYYSPGGHFELHYDTTGYHAVPLSDFNNNGVPDYVDSAAVYLDYAWHVEVTLLGFNPPPNQQGQPVERYPVYFTRFPYYGMTTFNDVDIPSLPGNNYTSFIEINSNFYKYNFYTTGYQALKVTAAHEFNHAIQLGYNFRYDQNYQMPDLFFMEMTSTWLEDYVFDQVNDYLQYLPDFFNNADYRAFNRVDGLTEYAQSLFLHMLAHQYQAAIVPAIWRQIIQQPALQALETVLRGRGTSFGAMFNQYAVWLYFTASRAVSGRYFPEAQSYPLLNISYDRDKLTQNLAGLFMRHVSFDAPQEMVQLVTVKAAQPGGWYTHIVDGDPLPGVPFGKHQQFNAQQQTPVLAVLTNEQSSTLENITYDLQEAPVQAGPQPVMAVPGKESVVFYNVPAGCAIRIYTLGGRKITTLFNKQTATHQVEWDLKDNSSRIVGSGIYLYVVDDKGKQKAGKIAVIAR